MSRVRVHNSLTSKILAIIFTIILIAVVIFVSVIVFNKDKNNNIFDLGNIDKNIEYRDRIINSYTDFVELLRSYNVTFEASESDFQTSSYLVLFQDYNPCSESKPKTIENVDVGDNITITYKIYNSCGWCERHMVLYILKVSKVEDTKNIEYNYVFSNNQLDCGTVS